MSNLLAQAAVTIGGLFESAYYENTEENSEQSSEENSEQNSETELAQAAVTVGGLFESTYYEESPIGPAYDPEMDDSPTPSPSPSITELESEALRAVEIAQGLYEPLSLASLTRLAIKSAAAVARSRRQRSDDDER